MKVLITGITGFVGSHLADYALANGHEVAGTVRARSRYDNIAHIKNDLELFDCSLRDPSRIRQILETFRPEFVFHLAAHSFVGSSFDEPAETLHNNLFSQLNLLEAVKSSMVGCRVQIAGSSEEYGLVHPEECPITESQPLRPLSPYAVSKVAQDLLAYQYHQSYNLPIVRTRAFNHEGPRRGEAFVVSNFAKQLAEIKNGAREPIVNVGSLSPCRDFTDVRDVVRAYWLALEKGTPGEVYNIGSGHTWSISDVLRALINVAQVAVEVVEDSSRLRPSDVPLLQADSSRFTELTGWSPEIPFVQTLADTFAYWLERV